MELPTGILFDHDGVLVASEPMHWMAWSRLMKDQGLPYDETLIRQVVGKTAPEIMKAILERYRGPEAADPAQITRLVQRKNELYLEEAKRGLQPYPGVLEGLKWVKARGIRTAVVSNARRRELHETLLSLGLTKWMDVILSREDVPSFKPDPAPYLAAAACLDLKGGECLAVEDSPTGIESALVARIPAVAVLTNFSESVMESPVPGRPDLKPTWIVHSMVEFFDRLRQLPFSGLGS